MELTELIPDALGRNLMVHARTEVEYLARFLPSPHQAENRTGEDPDPIW
jgi:hypothetical protein